MLELPSVRRERRLRDELRQMRDLMRAVADSDARPSNPRAIPIPLTVFASSIADRLDLALKEGGA